MFNSSTIRTGALAAAAAAMLGIGAAGASTVTINFDNAPGSSGSYVEQGFSFAPVNSSNSGQCYDGRCLHEVQQGTITTMTHVNGLAFSLHSFYFYMTGNENSITVTDTSSATSLILATGTTWDGSGPTGVSVTLEDGTTAAGSLVTGKGYFAFLGNMFDNVTEIAFGAHTSANTRLDDVTATVIPLPAAGFLLLGALGGLGLVARRRKTAA